MSIYIITQPPVFGFSSQSPTVRTGLLKERNEENPAGEYIRTVKLNILVLSHRVPEFPLQSIKDELSNTDDASLG